MPPAVSRPAAAPPSTAASLGVLAGLLALNIAVSVVGSLATATSVDDWYRALAKPAFTPPDWLFAPVWTALYVMMAVAAWLVWRRGGFTVQRRPLVLYFAQLAVNLAWPLLFFGWQRIDLALIASAGLVILVGATMLAFAQVSRVAGLLFVPYLIWVGFATALNGAIWMLNVD